MCRPADPSGYFVFRRKNLGYLWAIQHGATVVYETDDDNELKSAQPPTLANLEYYVYNASGMGYIGLKWIHAFRRCR